MPRNDQPSEHELFDVEITDLTISSAPGGRARARLEHVLLRWQRPERRRARLWLSGMLLVALLFTFIQVLFNPLAELASLWPLQTTQVSPVKKNPSSGPIFFANSNDILCLVQTSWSPNGAFIAMLGYTQSCSQSGYVPAQVNLYAATTASRVIHWRPDAAIYQALQRLPGVSVRLRAWAARKPGFGAPEASLVVPTITYLRLLWSPSSTQVAITFQASARFLTYDGLFLANMDGSHARVLLQPALSQQSSSGFSSLRWDLQRNAAVPFTLPGPALTYAWNAQGVLVPLSPLHLQGPPVAYANLPPGNPSGGHTFSIWQPGQSSVLLILRTPGAYLWSSNFAAWSPDGRYLITDIRVAGLMEPPGHDFPTVETLALLAAQRMPRLPDHDAALIPASMGARAVAWNPAGTRLAVYDQNGAIDLYDCATGRFLQSFRPSSPALLDGDATFLLWSPDGRSVLLSSAQSGLITLWRVKDRI